MKKRLKIPILSLFALGFGVAQAHADINISGLGPLLAAQNYAVAQSTMIVVSAAADPAVVSRGGSSLVTATMRDHLGLPLVGVSLYFVIQSGPGKLSSSRAITDASGQARVTFAAPSRFQGSSVQSVVRTTFFSVPAETTITTTKK